MRKLRFSGSSTILLMSLLAAALLPQPSDAQVILPPPPTPPFVLTAPRVNEITYVIEVENVNASWLAMDFALPRTRGPDTYVKVKEVKVAGAASVINYTDRDNLRMRTYTPDLKPGAHVTVNVTFYSLKYKVDYATRQPIAALSYPNQYAVFTQPERYIESNNTLVVERARTLVGNRTNPFRIAERVYDFARSYVTFSSQFDIHGALWALQNGRGDCTEFGTLFVALMRAAGIPARTVVGHADTTLSKGGLANATSLWVDSPHLWAEFYVEGYGWVPVDPTFGKKDPESHFGLSWAYYLPLIKGPTMERPYHSLASIQYTASTKVVFSSYLVTTPQTPLAFGDKAIQDLMAANDRTNLARRVANKAHDLSFNVTWTYNHLKDAYDYLINATMALDEGNPALSSQSSTAAFVKANQALEMISSAVTTEAERSVNRAWIEFRILGALGGAYYLENAKASQRAGDYLSVVQNAYFASSAANQAPSLLLFLAPVVFSVLTVGIVRRKGRRKRTKQIRQRPVSDNLQGRSKSA